MTGRASGHDALRIRRIQERIIPLALWVYFGLDALIVASLWGQWQKVATCIGVFIFGYLCNQPLLSRLAKRFGVGPVWWGRNIVNALTFSALGHLTHWNLVAWCGLLTMAAIQGAGHQPRALYYNLAFVVAMPGAALLDGVGLPIALTAALGAHTIFWLTYAGAERSLRLLEKLDGRQHELAAAQAELERLQVAAIQQQKLAGLGLMAAGISHEINNPMSFVRANLELLLEDLRGLPSVPASLAEYADDVLPATLDGLRRVNAIVEDLRGFAKDDSASLRTFDLNEEIESALRIAESRLKHRCQVVRDLGELPAFTGHREQMTQVFVNLLVNAAQAIPTFGTVTVSTRRVGDELCIAVRDTGAGMSEAVRQRLFEPFFTTKPPGEGTGLGLLAVETIVRRHGGAVGVETTLGEGSCFTVALPLAGSAHP